MRNIIVWEALGGTTWNPVETLEVALKIGKHVNFANCNVSAWLGV